MSGRGLIAIPADSWRHESIRAAAGSGKTYQLVSRYLRLVALGARPASPLDRFAGSWQAGAQELVAQARRLDANLAVMLGVVAGEQAVEDLPSQLISSLNRLRLTAESYSGLTAAQ